MISRLHGRSVFAMVRERGVRVRAGWLWCSMVIDPSAGVPHVGFAIGRAYGSAVDRNRLRRQLRAALQRRADDLQPGWYLFGVTARAQRPAWNEVAGTTDRLVAAAVARGTS